MLRSLLKFIARSLVAGVMIVAGTYWYMLVMPGTSYRGPLPELTAEEADLAERLRRHVRTHARVPRNTTHYENLEAAARQLEADLKTLGYAPISQVFADEDLEIRNIEVLLPAKEEAGVTEENVSTLVIGAHYDSAGRAPGANDNASGVAVLLELARMLRDHKMVRTRLRLVFFANEEPPHFKTDTMGSLVYARALHALGETVRGMVSLETLGFYSDQPGSQKYPPPLHLALPDIGNFVAIVGTLSDRSFVADLTGRFREAARFPSVGGVAPAWIPGITWSDHWSFGEVGIPSAMITDTAPFRYSHYHKESDTPDKLNYQKLARVTAGLARTLRGMAD